MKMKIFIFFSLFFMFTILNADQWYVATIDSEGDVGSYCDIAIDSNDCLHISYHSVTTGDLKYAFYDGIFHIYALITPVWWLYCGTDTSIATDSNNNPHIAFHDETNWYLDLDYAYYDGTNWNYQGVDMGGLNMGEDTDIFIDTLDHVHISYLNVTAPLLRYAYYNGSNWICSNVDSGAAYGSHNSIAVDSSCNPHISYMNQGLRYAVKNSGIWQYTTLEIGNGDTSLCLDNNDLPRIAFFRDSEAGNPLKYWVYDGTTWNVSIVTNIGDGPSYISMALDSDQNPHIAYQQDGYSGQDLKYAYFDGTSWQITTIDTIGDVGKYCQIALDSYDRPYIVYYDATNKDLKIACLGNNLGSDCDLSALACNNKIKISWIVDNDHMQSFIGYNLYRYLSNEQNKNKIVKLNQKLITGLNPFSYLDSDVKKGQKYLYQLTAIDISGKEQVLGTTQCKMDAYKNTFTISSIYPQPTTNVLTCRLNIAQPGDVEMKLYDLAGRIVKSQRFQANAGEMETMLDVSGLAGGVYMLEAGSSGEKSIKRVVVAR
jgi:hypothetical protein